MANPNRSPQPSDPNLSLGHPTLVRLDQWMAQSPWHPRFLPFLAYVGLLPLTSATLAWTPELYSVVYVVQCALPIWLLWRYRQLLPDLTLHFHWLAIPTGIFVAVAWIWLGHWMVDTFPSQFASQETTNFFTEMGPAFGWLAFSLRLVGMSVVVPLFEELFIRSLLIRSLHHFRTTAIGLIQIVQDLPILGEWLMHTSWGTRADSYPAVFGPQFDRTPLGQLSVFGVTASTIVFAAHHAVRDWPGCVVCALAYCLLLSVTRQKGLGPVCWAHGITNALLWAYTLQTNDWQFL